MRDRRIDNDHFLYRWLEQGSVSGENARLTPPDHSPVAFLLVQCRQTLLDGADVPQPSLVNSLAEQGVCALDVIWRRLLRPGSLVSAARGRHVNSPLADERLGPCGY